VYLLRAHAEALGDAGPPTLDEHVGPLGEPEHDVRTGRVLQVDDHRALAPVEQVDARVAEHRRGALTGPVDPDDVCAEVGQQHRRERARPYAGQFHHAQPAQRHAVSSSPAPPDLIFDTVLATR
jgi:hypothetical protein